MFYRGRLLLLYMWFLVSVILFFYCYSTVACKFDEVTLDAMDIPMTMVSYVHKVTKREIGDLYSPLRIHLHYGPSESDISTFHDIKNVMQKAVATISTLMEVIPVSGPLLLNRLGCSQRWTQGANKGLCSGLNKYYKGELCENKIDLFKIPSEHLTGLSVYSDMNDSAPSYFLPSGHGVVNADFIMYVISRVSDFCLSQNIQAYASYCRLDQNGRPVAGFINFCPNSIQYKKIDKRRMFHIAVHEIFHSLGFSKDLFHRFRNCDFETGNCTTPKRIVVQDSHGLFRLNLPGVVEQMQKHFKCKAEDFGAPLETMASTDSYSSHWDPLIMFGSIMAPTLAEPAVTSIDPISLSVLGETGWYRVNLSRADEYYWARGKGCEFGFEENCASGSYPDLCQLKSENNSLGCDSMLYSIGRCQAVKENDLCGLYKPNVKEQCRLKRPDKASAMRSKDMRCFLTKEKDKVHPICTVFACKSSFDLKVWLNGTWYNCINGSEVSIDETSLLCPQKDLLCQPQIKKHPYTRSSGDHSSSPFHNSPEKVISLRFQFDEPTPESVLAMSSLEHFKLAAIEAIAKHLYVPLDWIIDTLLTSYQSLVLIIYIDPPLNGTTPAEILQLVKSVQKFVKEKAFSFIFFEHGNAIPAVSLDVQVNPELELRTYDAKGCILLAIMMPLSMLFVLAAALSVVIKYIVRRQHRPHSTPLPKPVAKETQELSGITVE